MHDVGVIVRTERLSEDIADADRFKDCSNSTASDDAGSGRCWTKHHAATTMFTSDRVGDGRVLNGNLDHAFLRSVGCFSDGFADFVSLAKADSDLAFLIAGDDEGAEAEAAATFYDLGAAVDEDNLLGCFFRFPGCLLASGFSISGFRRHGESFLEFKSAFTGGIGQGFNLAVVVESATVENDFGDLFGLAALGDEFSNFSGGGHVGADAWF